MEEHKSFSAFIQNHTKLNKEGLDDVLDRVEKILENEDKLIQIPKGRVYILGDTHGNIDLTLHALKHLFPFDKDNHNQESHTVFDKIVFLGDFIDRGPYSVENVNLLMSLKAEYPEKIILIRGNHETREINCRFDFYEKVLHRYGIKTFERYNTIFSKLPLAILTWNNIFGVHGGIPEGLEKIYQLNDLKDEIDPEDAITVQLLWNDPVEKDGWFYNNFRGKYSRRFGKAAFEHFVVENHIKLVLRAHQRHKEGFRHFFESKQIAPKLISLDSNTSNWRKSTQKVFIIERSGEYRVTMVEHFKKKMYSHL